MNEQEKVDLTPYMNNGLHVRFADWLYRWFFQPVVDLLDRIERWSTRRWCEKQIPPNERV